MTNYSIENIVRCIFTSETPLLKKHQNIIENNLIYSDIFCEIRVEGQYICAVCDATDQGFSCEEANGIFIECIEGVVA